MQDIEKIRFQLCRRLRWKAPDPTVPPSNDAFFWCSQTMNCLGPDGKVCNEEGCQSERQCYESL